MVHGYCLQSWTDRISESSDEPGAVGGYHDDDIVYKHEPLDDDDEFLDLDLPQFEPVCEKSRIRHDHTYSAPPGGVPHVRKMDIKVFICRWILCCLLKVCVVTAVL